MAAPGHRFGSMLGRDQQRLRKAEEERLQQADKLENVERMKKVEEFQRFQLLQRIREKAEKAEVPLIFFLLTQK